MKLIIDIPDEVYASAKNGELNEIQSMYICGSVCNGIPYEERPQGDLISRNLAIAYATSGLVKRIDGEDWIRISEVKQSLNDAPTVTDHSVELVQKSIELGRRVGKAEEAIESQRPQGEWSDISTDGRHTGWIACSVCGQEPPNESNLRTNFCPNCGAKMQNNER